jgi:hypothetical protein
MNELLERTNIEKAIHLVRVCNLTAYKACKLYGVKSGTLSAHLSGKVRSEVKGRPPRFTVEEEKTLLDVVIQLATWCFPQSISEARKTKPVKRKRIAGNAGQCLTNQEAIDIMEEQEQSKRKKLSDKVFDKKMREENKQKQKQETENNRKLRLVKKQNAQRKECLCGKKQVNDKSNKDYWINCYKCGTWCCPDCLPEAFKGKVTEVYTCSSCVNVNES